MFLLLIVASHYCGQITYFLIVLIFKISEDLLYGSAYAQCWSMFPGHW